MGSVIPIFSVVNSRAGCHEGHSPRIFEQRHPLGGGTGDGFILLDSGALVH